MRKTKKQLVTLGLAVMLAASINMTAFAGQWVQENNDFKYQEDNGSYPVNTWKWIDGNNDGVAECYYCDGKVMAICSATPQLQMVMRLMKMA